MTKLSVQKELCGIPWSFFEQVKVIKEKNQIKNI